MQTIGFSADSSPHRTRRARIFAHRGSSGLFAEHTRAAYLRALEEGGRSRGGHDLALELKHPSPFGHQLEEKVLRTLLAHGWDPETSSIACRDLDGRPTHTVDVTFMSFYPESLMHLAELIPWRSSARSSTP